MSHSEIRLAELERENAKLRQINQVLVDRMARSMDIQGGAYSLFQTAIDLEQKVRKRTLRELERSNHDLERARKLAETMRARLAEAIEATNEGFALFDAEDRLVLCNSKFRALWPDIADRIGPGMAFRDIKALAATSPAVTKAHSRPEVWLAQRLAQHDELRGPYTYRLADNRWVQVNERRTADGGIVGVYSDITDLKAFEARQRERQLAGKSALLQATLDNLAQGVAVYDREEQLVARNDRFAELLRLPADVARLGATFEDFRGHNATLGARGLSDAALLRDGLSEDHLGCGRVLEVRRSAMPAGGFVLTVTDITERKRIELALRDRERRIRLITDAVPALITYVDAEKRYQFVNKAYEDWFRRRPKEIIGQPMWAVMDAGLYEMRKPYILRALAGETVTYEMELPTDGGPPRYALATYIPHFDERREVLGFFALIHDVTERQMVALALEEAKESLEQRVAERTAELTALNVKLHQEIAERAAIEEQLRLAKADAEQANLSKTKFLAAASHDLLQPLNAARLFVSALSDLDHPAHNRALIDNTDVALGAVEDLLSALLDISKLDAGAVHVEWSDFPIKSMLGGMTTEFAAMAKERGLEFAVASSSAVVHSDIRLLRRILQNFLANAMRYTRHGRVLLGCRRTRDGLRLEVWDTGPGIPQDKLKEIFEEFRRLETSHTTRNRGIGLGLAIVDRVARTLGHTIGVRSVPGKGSVFWVRVPYGHYRAPAHPPEPIRKPSPDRLTGVLALVVDNEQGILDGMRALLGGWACGVLLATSVEEALAAVAESERLPDIIIADYHLEDGTTGVEAIERVRESCGRAIPALLITANRTTDLLKEVHKRGCRLLNKPVKPAQLRAMLTGMLP
ncbi:MAG TPA: NahK/ErcS family hybrid sensor histidine kinase/response regulator [Azospirillaceae bacterium]|nr:NahK/ErcS family hybrid sensor histidine kinase/response regulator [Azospirillaceae bacterium]